VRFGVVTLALLLVLAVPAQATLVFNRGVDTSVATVWAADDDGANPHQIAASGLGPRISPDGRTVAYQTIYGDPGTRPQLALVPAGGGDERVLLDPQWEADTQAWSPDSKTIAAVTGTELGTKRLLLIDVATGSRRTIATGYFYGVSFSPSGGAVVFSRAASDRRYPPRASLWAVPVAGGKRTRLTRGHPDVYPLWGPDGIAFSRMRKPVRKYDAWKQDIYTLSSDGGGLRRITRMRPAFLLTGLTPVSFSADGLHLLAQFGGQDTAYAETVDPFTGKVRIVGRERDLIVGAALSHDGLSILATRGAVEGGAAGDVVSIPYSGGAATVLAEDAFSPDWTK
jgi:WD40 repeat protein